MQTFVVRLNPDTRPAPAYSSYPSVAEYRKLCAGAAMNGFHEAVNFLPEKGVVRGYLPPRHLRAMRNGEPFNLITITAKTANKQTTNEQNDQIIGMQAGCRYAGEHERRGVPQKSRSLGLIWHYSCPEALSLLLPTPIQNARATILGLNGEWVWGPTREINKASFRRILEIIECDALSTRDNKKLRRISAHVLDEEAVPEPKLESEEDFDAEVVAALRLPLNRVMGNEFPPQREVRSFQYQRDAKVVAYALRNSKGICFDCSKPGPFVSKTTGLPYLEVHHKTPLKEGGPDTIDNVVALCPNCHRQRHFG